MNWIIKNMSLIDPIVVDGKETFKVPKYRGNNDDPIILPIRFDVVSKDDPEAVGEFNISFANYKGLRKMKEMYRGAYLRFELTYTHIIDPFAIADGLQYIDDTLRNISEGDHASVEDEFNQIRKKLLWSYDVSTGHGYPKEHMELLSRI